MGYETIRLEYEEQLAILTIDRPKALNAFNAKALQEVELALRVVHHNAQLRALIVTGSGEKAFVAGADIAEMVEMTPTQAREFAGIGHRVFHMMETLSIPTIAAVNGFALGGGCELALCCDLIYASENAKLGLPEVTLGVIPGFGGTQRLTRLVGRVRAKELIFTGEMVDAAKAKEIGLVLEVLPADRLMEHCRSVAHKLLKRGPLAIAQAKRVIEFGADGDLRSANELERQGFSMLFGSEDQREGMRAFLEKRQPMFKGR
ncbi:MAG: enoyl-CoA hydratase/isomerase family protein [Myxococcales bacterium]|nr:enoyl-CoA hydratase/isomerase family protein [Myxococcales bacterium]